MLRWCIKSHALSFSTCHKFFAPKESCHFKFLHNADLCECLEVCPGNRWHFYFLLAPLKLLLSSTLALPSLSCPKVMPSHPTPKCSCSSWIVPGHVLRSPVAQLISLFAGHHSSHPVCVPRFPFWRDRTEHGQCKLIFQLQKKPRCYEAAFIPSRNVDRPSHLQRRCDQHQFPCPFCFHTLKCDSPDLSCFHTHFLLSSCTAAFGW